MSDGANPLNKLNDDLTFIQMFSGIEGFRLGLERSGWRCVWSNDNDKYACKVSRKNYPDGTLIEGDIREISAKTIPNHRLLTAGFPCQAFSVAGQRKATAEARGTLFTHIARVVARKRPQLLLLENVKGLLSSESGRTFAVILRTLGNLGYLLEWQVLNSKHFGVPQNRERVFLVGHLGGTGSRQIFPLGQDGELSARAQKGESEGRQASSTLEASYGKTKSLSNMIQVGSNPEQQGNRVYSPSGLSPTVPTACGGRHIPQIANTVDADGYLRFGHRPRDKDGKPQLIPIGYRRIRRLTPTECERLQGFPDGWTEWGISEEGYELYEDWVRTRNGDEELRTLKKPSKKGLVKISDTQRYKLLGNAITVNVVKYLGIQLKYALERPTALSS